MLGRVSSDEENGDLGAVGAAGRETDWGRDKRS
jgi:hypothetical protein